MTNPDLFYINTHSPSDAARYLVAKYAEDSISWQNEVVDDQFGLELLDEDKKKLLVHELQRAIWNEVRTCSQNDGVIYEWSEITTHMSSVLIYLGAEPTDIRNLQRRIWMRDLSLMIWDEQDPYNPLSNDSLVQDAKLSGVKRGILKPLDADIFIGCLRRKIAAKKVKST
jgi:hypothetical protein